MGNISDEWLREISDELQTIKDEKELELYKKKLEVKLMCLPFIQFEYEVKRDWMQVFALGAVVVFGVAAFALQFISSDGDIRGWGRNFLMVIIGGLMAIIPRGIKTDGLRRVKDSDSTKGG
jgi:hypothetical protein